MAIKFRTNVAKALEVILWFAAKRPGIDFHAILKLLFFADKRHLNTWGRPIVGDRYCALPYGPVAQTTYDLLKRDPLAMEVLQVEDLPFEVQNRYRVRPLRTPDFTKFSESDIEVLEEIWAQYGQLNFNELTRASHDDPAYKKAEQEGRAVMFYADFLEGPNADPDVIEELSDTSFRMRL
jgi:uncharacterized phage-associated protein